jgi:hypothetical protein
MSAYELRRWGLLLDTLSEISDVERQLVGQVHEPASFLPDELLERWDRIFRGGRGLLAVGVSEHMLSALLDFDEQLEELIEFLPEDADDKVSYIRHDEVWRVVRELADLTLNRIAELSLPNDPEWGVN